MKQTETNNGKKGGLLKGKPHYDEGGRSVGGIKAVITDNNRPVELEGGEVIINREASKKYWKELSKINQSAGGGVPIGPPSGADEDPDEYGHGGVIEFNANNTPSYYILKYAQKIKHDHPEVWKLGGNIFGNEAFKNLEQVQKRGYWLDSEEWMYKKWRAFVARHQRDYRIAGVIAMLKWVDKVEKGWPYMKNLIEAEIKKREGKEPKKMKEGGGVQQYPFALVIKKIANPNSITSGGTANKYKGAYQRIFDILNEDRTFMQAESAEEVLKGNDFYLYFDFLPDANELEAISKTKNVEILQRMMTGGKVKKKNQGGDCYQAAGEFAIEYRITKGKDIKFEGEPHVVHGEVEGQGAIKDLRYGHAWIEDDENVYDFSNGRNIVLPKVVYYAFGKVKTKEPRYYRYTFDEARKKMLNTGVYGPWDLQTESGL